MPNVEVPGVGVVAFPDTMTPDQIVAAIQGMKPPAPADTRGLGSLFGDSFRRGVRQEGTLLGDVLPGMFSKALGDEAEAQRQFRQYEQAQRDIARELPTRYGSYEDVKGLGDVPGYVAETIGESLPSVLTSVLGGGVGAAAAKGVAKLGARKLAEEEAKKALARGALAGAGVSGAALAVPETFASVRNDTGQENIPVSLLFGAINTALDTALPAVVISKLTGPLRDKVVAEAAKRIAPGIAGRVAKETGKAALIEGATEGTQEISNALAARFVDENFDPTTMEKIKQYADAALRGAIVGGTVGGGVDYFAGEKPQVQTRDDELYRALKEYKNPTIPEGQTMLPSREQAMGAEDAALAQAMILSPDGERLPYGLFMTKMQEQAVGDPTTAAILAGDISPQAKLQALADRVWQLENKLAPADAIAMQEYRPGLGDPAELAGAPGKVAAAQEETAALAKTAREAITPAPITDTEATVAAANAQTRAPGAVAPTFGPAANSYIDSLNAGDVVSFPVFQRDARIVGTKAARQALDQYVGAGALKLDGNGRYIRTGLPISPPVPEASQPGPMSPSRFIAQMPLGDTVSVQAFGEQTGETDPVKIRDRLERFAAKGDLERREDGTYIRPWTAPPPRQPNTRTQPIAEIEAQRIAAETAAKRRAQEAEDARARAEMRPVPPPADIAPEGVETAPSDIPPMSVVPPAAESAPKRGRKPKQPSALVAPPGGLPPKGQFSSLGTQAAPGKPGEPKTNPLQVVTDRLEKLRQRGKQARILADAIENDVLKRRNVTADQALLAFEMADVLAAVLPEGADHRVRFVRNLTRATGTGATPVQGVRIAPTERMRGIIQLSLDPQWAFAGRATAAHEAFHVIQDVIANSDPAMKRAFDQAFPSESMTLDLLPKSIKTALRTTYADPRRPGTSNYDLLKNMLPSTVERSEMEAYVFGLLDAARSRGQSMGGLGSAFRRFLSLFNSFGERLGNMFRGAGFRTADDVMQAIGNSAMREAETPVRAEADGQTKQYSAFSPQPFTNPKGETAYDAIFGKPEDTSIAGRIKAAYEGITQGEYRIRDYLRTSLIDQYHGVMALEKKQNGGQLPSADLSAYKALTLSERAGHIWEQLVRHGGTPTYVKSGEGGYFQIEEDGSPGLSAIFGDVARAGLLPQTMLYMAAKRGQRLNAEGKIVPMTPEYIKAGLDEAKAHPEIAKAAEAYQAFNKKLMKLAVDADVISAEQAATFGKYNDYYPFYRSIEEDPGAPKAKVKWPGVGSRIEIKKLKGGEDPLADPLTALLTNTKFWIAASMKNIAAQRTMDLAVGSGAARVLNGSEEAGPGEAAFNARVDGKNMRFAVSDPLLVTALGAQDVDQIPRWLRFMGMPAQWLRELITRDPGFMLANAVRDTFSAWVASGENLTPVVDTVSGFSKALRNSPSMLALRNAGITSSYEYGGRQLTDAAKLLSDEMTPTPGIYQVRSASDLAKLVKRFTWDYLGKGAEASDAATRISVYEKALAETGNPAEAAYRALDLMNFSRRGASPALRAMTMMVPFLNARLQGFDVLGRGMNDHTVKFFTRGAVLSLVSVMALLAGWDDDEVNQAEHFIKNNNLLIPLKGIGLEGVVLAIPKPFEVGLLFQTIPEDLSRYMMDKQTGRETAQSFTGELASTFGVNPIPQALKPILEVVTNHDFFTGRTVVGRGVENAPSAMQYTERTSDLAKQVGAALDMSPQKIEHVIQGYGGTIGTYLLSAADSVVRNLTEDNQPARKITDNPLVRRFAKTAENMSVKQVNDLYDLSTELDGLTRTMKMLEMSGDVEALMRLQEDNLELLSMKKTVDKLQSMLRKLRAQEKMIRLAPMDPEQKRELLDMARAAEIAATRGVGDIQRMAGR